MRPRPKSLENAVRRVHGATYADQVHAPLKSFFWKIDMAHYHACESERVIKEALESSEHFSENDPGSVAISKALILGSSPGASGRDIFAAQFKAEAHIIASAQALHSLCDILSVIVYWALQLDTAPHPPNAKRLNLYTISQSLTKLTQYMKTKSLIDAVIASSEFKYLAAYTNTTKHKSLVPAMLSASFVGDNRNGMKIREFSYANHRGETVPYDWKWSRDFLDRDNKALR